LRATHYRQCDCCCQSEPDVSMYLRVEHFTPPEGYRWGEWDEVAGWTLHRSNLTDRLRNDGYPLPSLNRTESGRWRPSAFRRAFPSRHRPTGQYPEPAGAGRRRAPLIVMRAAPLFFHHFVLSLEPLFMAPVQYWTDGNSRRVIHSSLKVNVECGPAVTIIGMPPRMPSRASPLLTASSAQMART
jgi:hypothetical protein